MRRKVLILVATVATVLVTLGFAKWFEAKDRADQIVNRDEICSHARRTVKMCLRLYLSQTNNKVKLKHTGKECKVTLLGRDVTRLGRDEYEVQSSFLVANNPTPVHYTVVGRITIEKIDKIDKYDSNALSIRGGLEQDQALRVSQGICAAQSLRSG